MAMSH